MAIYPGAKVRLLSREYAGYNALTIYNRTNLHVAVSLASTLFGYFNRAYKPSSHYYVLKSGKIIQYVDTSRQAEADLEGNDATLSVETQGGLTNAQTEPWTPAQVEALAQLHAFHHKTHGILLRLATDSKIGDSSKGLSWHRLGIDGNFPSLPSMLAGRMQRGGGMHYSTSRGKTCPGDAKILQIPDILARAKEIVAGGASPVNNPVAPPTPEPTPAPPAHPAHPAHPTNAVSVDGYWGKNFTSALQRDFRSPVDGVVSKQSAYWVSRNPALTSGWESVSIARAIGSPLMGQIQDWVGTPKRKRDRLIGPDTIKRLQRKLKKIGYYSGRIDGRLDKGSLTVRGFQHAHNDGKVK